MNPGKEQVLRRAIAEMLGEDAAAISDHDNLFEAGLDSLGLMRLVNRCRREGLKVGFADLAREPTLSAWCALLDTGEEPERAASSIGDPPAPADAEASAEEPAPLGAMQHAYWVGRDTGQRLGGVAAHLYVEFDRPATGGAPAIDPDRLRSALRILIARHETLRTRITADGKQVVLPTLAAPLSVHDLSRRPEGEVWSHLEATRDEFSHQMLDVECGQVFAVALSLLPDGATRLHLDLDMIAADAVSYRILLSDLAAVYRASRDCLAPLALTYRGYLALAAPGKDERARTGATVWAPRLGTLPGPPVLPERPSSGQPRVARRTMWLAPERKATLAEAARRNGVTVAMTVATVFAEVVGRWSATERFLLNVPMFDRLDIHPDVDRVVGDFSSSIMLDVDLSAAATFAERVRALQGRMHADAAHAGFTGLDVLRDLGRQRGETVLAPVVFTSALGLGELFAPEVTEIVGRPVWVISQGPQVLLDAQVTEFEDGLLVNWDTREDAFGDGVVDAMFDYFVGSLDRVIDRPDAWGRPLASAGTEPPRRTHLDRPVRVVDHLGRDRPDGVPGRLRIMGEERAGASVWARAERDGDVITLGNEADALVRHGVATWPSDIEEALRADERVRDAAILRTEFGFAAAIVCGPSGGVAPPPSGKAFRAELARRVPPRLLPARILVLEALPRDRGSRIDREALARMLATDAAADDRLGPRSDLERVIADIWAEVLGLEEVGVNEEFIALGGDSLLAARVVSRLQEDLDTDAITLRALFRSPTIAELAEHLRSNDDPGRLDDVAAIILEIRGMSDEEVAARLGEGDLSPVGSAS